MAEHKAEPVHSALVHAGALAPVVLGGADERAWLDCDLASFAENRLGDTSDPSHLDAARRADWLARATDEEPMSLRARSRMERCYWLLHEGRRAGTLALSTSSFGAKVVRLSSLYVLPTERGKGVGRLAIRAVQEALARHGWGLRLETSWSWQRTVRFYVKLGLWVHMWKRDLSLCWDVETPPPRIEVGDEEASLSVPLGGSDVTLARARRRGEALALEWPPTALKDEERIGHAYWQATSTLALSLALHGWPLVRSREEWARCRYADAGPPEALAQRITLWEAWDRKHGWQVSTPRIPGLEYPTWEELEARWAAERSEI